jgi:hypothetical protein
MDYTWRELLEMSYGSVSFRDDVMVRTWLKFHGDVMVFMREEWAVPQLKMVDTLTGEEYT